ncbi:MAG TPA: DIP1984 family protein [Propionicimonas sp.]|nr:DIP1984 family protein [Propionicimonas sp.]
MKLAEALAERADAVRKLEELRARIEANATFQEGETPTEDAAVLLREADAALAALEVLMRRINLTNTAARLADGRSLTDALARRDTLRLKHSIWVQAANAASGTRMRGWGRQLRSELATLSALDVPALRGQTDAISQELRKLDLQIQEANWKVDLVD